MTDIPWSTPGLSEQLEAARRAEIDVMQQESYSRILPFIGWKAVWGSTIFHTTYCRRLLLFTFEWFSHPEAIIATLCAVLTLARKTSSSNFSSEDQSIHVRNLL